MVPVSFASSCADLNWQDIRWGYEHRLLSWEDVVAYSAADSHQRPDVAERISGMNRNSAHKIENILREIDDYSAGPNRKWLYICISWLFINRDALKDPFGDVERIFADFDYPDEIASFVGFMPPSDGYNPSLHTKKENYDRLERNWRDYVERGYRT